MVLLARQADFLPDMIKGIAFGLKDKFPKHRFCCGLGDRREGDADDYVG